MSTISKTTGGFLPLMAPVAAHTASTALQQTPCAGGRVNHLPWSCGAGFLHGAATGIFSLSFNNEVSP